MPTASAEISDDVKSLCVACSTDMLNDLMSQVKDSMQLLLLAKRSPYLQRDRQDFEQIVKSFKHLQEKMQLLHGNPFYYQIIKNQLLSLAFECVGFLYRKNATQQISNRKEALFNAFDHDFFVRKRRRSAIFHRFAVRRRRNPLLGIREQLHS